ncbi:protein GAMETE EXPRESSED 1 [Nymphaea colorata]|nr:protein GAMETE EXPRESSED 1 [Nymphaea colorata]XP_049935816.1 protein GAMETE EXPRESSED 1 [Nymphaea colorata]
MGSLHPIVTLLVFFSCCCNCHSWSWFSSSTSSNSEEMPMVSNIMNAEFSMDNMNNPKGVELVEKAKSRLVSSNSCWQEAYQKLFSSCGEIIGNQEKQSRLAWHLSDCFQKDSGRPGFSACDSAIPMAKCLKNLDEFQHNIYLQFFLETNAICHQLQSEAFKRKTERLVNELQRSASYAEEKLEAIEEKSDLLLKDSDRIHDSLTSIDMQTEELVRTSRVVEDHIGKVLDKSKAVFEQSKEIAASQSAVLEAQEKMKEGLSSSVAFLSESYESLDQGIAKLQSGTLEIQREIYQVGDSMSLQMKSLQDKADDIENVASVSLDKQRQLLDGQSQALQGLNSITQFLSQVLEESRSNLQKLADFGEKQQEELLRRQEQLHETHDRLVENSVSMLAAQEAFEKKQAIMFTSLEKLFSLHNAILLESRAIKTFFFYLGMVFVIYMMTSAKQTFGARARLYLGLCIVFAVEILLVRIGANDLDQQSWVSSKIFLIRLSFLSAALIQIVYSVFSFRDYEILNHRMLLTVIEKLNAIEGAYEDDMTSLCTGDDTALVSLMKREILEEEDIHQDPDYHLPEEKGENSVTDSVSRTYNFRPRNRRMQPLN